jgi:hypothetical protein
MESVQRAKRGLAGEPDGTSRACGTDGVFDAGIYRKK